MAAVLLLAAALAWHSAAPMPVPRSEVTAAAFEDGFAVVGGFLPDGTSSSRVDFYSVIDGWRRLPDLPVAVNHAMAASDPARLYVAGGYTRGGGKLRSAYVLDSSAHRWQALPPMPAARAAGGAAVLGGKLYVVGGVGPAGLARQMLVFDPRRRRWSAVPGPTPREHLAVTATYAELYAIGGRTAGFDTNVATVERYLPVFGWLRLPPLPLARGGTGAAWIGDEIVSIGGEAPGGTIGSVYAFNRTRGRWRRLPDLPTPRHGLGVVAVGRSVYAVGGGTVPGLSASGANELLELR